MGVNFQIPFMAVFIFCAIVYFWNGVATGVDFAEDRFGDGDRPDDVASSISYGADQGVSVVQLIFDLITFGSVPWDWLRWTLTIFCGSVLTIGFIVLVAQVVGAIF